MKRLTTTLAAALAAGSLGSTLALWREKTFQTLSMTALALLIWAGVWEAVHGGLLGQHVGGVAAGATVHPQTDRHLGSQHGRDGRDARAQTHVGAGAVGHACARLGRQFWPAPACYVACLKMSRRVQYEDGHSMCRDPAVSTVPETPPWLPKGRRRLDPTHLSLPWVLGRRRDQPFHPSPFGAGDLHSEVSYRAFPGGRESWVVL